jgi:hypothetical protein
MATMMTVTNDTLQIYRGTGLVVRAKAERMARELGNAAIVELVPDRILALTPVPWYSLSLFEDRARRILAAVSVLFALGLAGLSFMIWLFASLALISSRADLSEAQSRTQDKAMQLLSNAEQLRASPMREQLATFTSLNDALLDLDGFLQIYEIKGNKTRWRATVPANVTADRINAIGGKTIETKPSGAVIGNITEIEYEAAGGKP